MSATDYDPDDDLDYGADCQTCGGEQIEECDDILGCFVKGCDGNYHTCPNCKGSGRARDQWFW